jgi:hypothetical protein
LDRLTDLGTPPSISVLLAASVAHATPRSFTDGTNVLLGGQYIEIGLGADGSAGPTIGIPSGFFGSPVGAAGFVSDLDGFEMGQDISTDYWIPGIPEQRWNFGFNDGTANRYLSLAQRNSDAFNGMTVLSATTTDETSGSHMQARTVVTLAGADGVTPTFRVTKVHSFNDLDYHVRIDVTVENLTSTAFTDVRYMQNFDPDNTASRGGDYVTQNDVLNTFEAGDGIASVRAQSFSDGDPIFVAIGSRAPITLVGVDPRQRVCQFGFVNPDPFAVDAYDAAHPKGFQSFQDEAICLTTKIDSLDGGASTAFTYYINMSPFDAADTLDTDGDGLSNGQEAILGTSPTNPDTDGDGENDGVEVGDPGMPNDTDGDGSNDALESDDLDIDGDGFVDESDVANANACIPNINAGACDQDGDGLSNAQEELLGTSPINPDTDGDGENDGAENIDSDGDNIIDALESSIEDMDGDGFNDEIDSDNLNACIPDALNFNCDIDNDGLINGFEGFPSGTDPNNPDTDGDGELDGAEVGDVENPFDSDDDGIIDALESSIIDTDGDGVFNESDPANDNPCIPSNLAATCDADEDGLINAIESFFETDLFSGDTDGDGEGDASEVGDVESPNDTDGDGIIDALESILNDVDGDAVTDENDPANSDPCIPNEFSDACDSDADGLSNGVEIALEQTPLMVIRTVMVKAML